MRFFDVAAPGTPIEAWHRRLECHPPPPFDWRLVHRAVVVAPHPDDETLGLGGTLHRLCANGVPLKVVTVTDGEAADPAAGAAARAVLAARRQSENHEALQVLGLPADRLLRLGLPDGGIAEHEDELTNVLESLLTEDTWTFVTWREDGHPDHEAAARATMRAARHQDAKLVEYPIWAWHWDAPDDSAMPWAQARAVELTDAEVVAKRAAVAVYASQTESAPGLLPVLPDHVLARLIGSTEVLFEEGPAAR